MSGAWRAFDTELARWERAGRVASFWWRDDDAVDVTSALSRLLETQVPIALAVVPKFAVSALATAVDAAPHVTVVQHGWSHENHAPEGEKSTELHPSCGLGVLTANLRAGRTRLQALFGTRFHPTLVPPWNRIAASLEPELGALGFEGLSAFGPRPRQDESPRCSVKRINTHIDLIDWRGTRGFRGTQAVLADAAEHLAARRLGSVDAAEPTGLLSHHLLHDESCWSFVSELMVRCRRHAAVRWLSIAQALALPQESARDH